MDYLQELNEAQRKAVEKTEGPLLILAGAGAGKTKTITYRILHLIQKGVDPGNILAVTFTNKAAKEMRERVDFILKNITPNKIITEYERPYINTFHGLGHFIIKQNHKILGIKKHFTILDRNDAKKIIKESLEKRGVEPKTIEPNKIISIISKEKGNFIGPEEYKTRIHSYFEEIIGNVWTDYEQKLKDENSLDFDDLLTKAVKILEKEEVASIYKQKWKYIHIDEYQDTNAVQYKMVKHLIGIEKNICVVGDIDQNIYSWRGANIKNILNFEKDFTNAKTIILEENYRSTQTILAIANRAIEKNKLRFEKKLVTRNSVGDKVSIFEALTENHEAQFVAKKIEFLIQNSLVPPEEIAVLYRANFQSRVLEEELLKKNIGYQVLGTKFLERKEIKDVISFLRLAVNPDSISDLKRIINIPPRGIGKTTLLKIVEKKEEDLPIKTKIKINNFKNLILQIKEFSFRNKLSETIKFIIKESGLDENLKKTEEDRERIGNLKELVNLCQKYDGLEPEEAVEKFLEETSLTTDQDSEKKEEKSVRLMTVHASKGLEFSYVFIVGLEQGLFPIDKNEDANISEEEAEEERRLFYVAITRARKKLFLSYAQSRTIYGKRNINLASEFLIEIPDEYLEKEFLNYSPRRKPLLDIEF